MPENMFSTIIAFLLLGLWILAILSFFVRLVKNRHAPVETVRAVVIDKHTIETFSKYSGTGKREKFVVVFSSGGRKFAFHVSEFSYNGYRIGDTGMLTYQGDKIIGFK